MISVVNSKDEEEYTIRERLFPCHCCVKTMVAACVPAAVCMSGCHGCCKYAGGQEYRSIVQPIYPPLKTGTEDPVGSITSVSRADPCCPCMAMMVPIRVKMAFPPNQRSKGVAQMALLALASLGMEIPGRCKACCGPPFRVPFGVPCLDLGLETTMSYTNFEEMLNQ